MKKFELYIPTRIIFGNKRIGEIGHYAKKYGKKLMMVYGQGSIKKNGVYNTVIKSLEDADIEIVEFSGVRPNPVISHTRNGVSIAKKEKIDFVLGVGGGSVSDEAKAIAAGALYDGDVWDFYKDTEKIKKALDVLIILTLPATGSEMNGGTVITNEETTQKFGFIDEHLYPKVSILDPSVTLEIPLDYTAYSAVDITLHLLESYFTHEDTWNPIQDRYVEGIVKTVIECMDILLKEPRHYQARATLMWASSLAWNGLGTAGVGEFSVPNHMFGHVISAYYDLAHGATLSIITPALMKYKYKDNIRQFVSFAENIFGIKGSNKEEVALAGIEAFKNWFIKIGSPVSFKDAKLPTDQLNDLVESVIELSKLWNIKGYSKKAIFDILNSCLD